MSLYTCPRRTRFGLAPRPTVGGSHARGCKLRFRRPNGVCRCEGTSDNRKPVMRVASGTPRRNASWSAKRRQHAPSVSSNGQDAAKSCARHAARQPRPPRPLTSSQSIRFMRRRREIAFRGGISLPCAGCEIRLHVLRFADYVTRGQRRATI